MGILDRLLGRKQEQPAEVSNSMHAVLITFTSSASLDDLKGPFTDYANALREMQGLIVKTWIRHGRTLESAMVIVLDGLNSGMPGGCRAQPFSTLSRGHGKS
jgi:hypothetical protein